MSPTVQILLYCVPIAFASLLGGWLPSLVKLTHLRKQLLMSAVAGVMLGVALLHMLPLAIHYLPDSAWVGGSLMAGLLGMFFLMRVFHTHTHAESDGHAHDHSHDHEHSHDHKSHSHASKPMDSAKNAEGEKTESAAMLRSLGLLSGMALHSLLDGVALSVSVAAEAAHDPHAWLLGLGAFFAIALHKPLDALAITSLLHASNFTASRRNLINGLFALVCPVGAIAFWLAAPQFGEWQSMVVGCVLGFSAGLFLCIALADLLPEVAFHSHDRGKLSIALLLGVGLSIGVEMMHSHDHGSPTSTHSDHEPHGGSHAGHNH